MPVTKHNFIVKNIGELKTVLRRAFFIAKSGRPGPVLIDILKDVFVARAEFEKKPTKALEKVKNSDFDEQISKAAELIQRSEKPLIYAGGGVISAGAADELGAFAKRIGAPVTLSLMGIGAYPSTDPYFTGMIGMHGSKVSALAVNAADLVIAIGARFSDRVVCNPKTFAKKAKVIHIDIDRSEVNKNIVADVAVISDVKTALAALCKEAPYGSRSEWLSQIELWKKKNPRIEAEKSLCSPQYVIDCVSKLINEDDIVATDVGQHQIWTAQCYPIQKPRTFISSGGLGTMGFGLGAAIGAAFAQPERQVVLFTGDGSFGMNLTELATAVKTGRNIVIIIMNNGVLGMVRQWQKVLFEKRYSQTTLDRGTDFVKVAEAFGATGFRITNHDEVMKVLCSAFAKKGTVVVDVVVDKDINVLPMVPAGKNIDEQILNIDN